MALIEVYHTIASMFPVDPNYDPVANPITEGQLVRVDTNGFVQIANTTSVNNVVGLAGDSISTVGSNTNASNNNVVRGNGPFAANIIIGSNGATRWTQNRVSDLFNETKGSGKLTVYMGVGEFWTDQYASGQTWTPGSPAYTDGTGRLTTTLAGSARKVGMVLDGPTDYPSGVPGITVKGSMTLGKFVHFSLNVMI